MEFGDRLKQLRTNRDWTQPEASAEIGVEQSYLSKLENGAIPSADVFRRLLDTYRVSVAEILEEVGEQSINQLRRIPDVDEHISSNASRSHTRRRHYVQALIVATAMGAALTYAGNAELFFPDTAYTYTISSDSGANTGQNSPKSQLLTFDFRGSAFTLPDPSGALTYTLADARKVERLPNKLILFVGVFLFTGGLLALLAAGTKRR